MKREFLEGLDLGEGVRLPKAAVDAIMDEHGRGIEAIKNANTTLTTERDGLRTQLENANATIQSYKDMDIDGIKRSADEWERKYNTETQELKDALTEAEYGFAVEKAAAGMRFSSESARKQFVAELKAKKLSLLDGKLLGMEDFTRNYRETDPDAFAPEDNDKIPVAAKGTGGGGTKQGVDAALRAAFGLTNITKE